MTTVHTYPVHDLLTHDTDGADCICGPTLHAHERDDGTHGWQYVHHALDKRLEES